MALREALVCTALVFATTGCPEEGGDSGKTAKSADGDKANKTAKTGKEAKSAKPAGSGDDKPASAPGTGGPEPAPAPAPEGEPSEPAPAADACGPENEVPAIPGDTSNPPSVEEWKTACKVNTQGPNSQAPDCTSMVKREWLKVTCTGDMQGYENFEGFGNQGADYFKQVKTGKGGLVSFVVRMKKGKSQKVRMCRTTEKGKKESGSLFVSWPGAKDKPTIIAVGRGPECEKPKK